MLKRFHQSKATKRILSLCLALAMLFALLPAISHNASALTAGDTVYLKPNANWKNDNARFAIYYFNNSGSTTWVSMSDSNGDGIYEATMPTGSYTHMIFCRMSPSATANNWNNKWNQTADLPIPTDDTNLYTVKENTWDKGGGSWSVFGSDEGGDDTGDDNTEVGYVIAGNNVAVFGSQWDPTNIANTMTLNADTGLYEKVYENVPVCTLIFKVTDGTWNNSWGDPGSGDPDGNYVFNVTAVSDVTITFHAETKAVNAVAVPTGEEPEPDATEYCLIGYINGADDGCEADYASTNHKFVDGTLTMTITETSYVYIKTADNANWYMTQTYVQTNSATFYNTTTGAMEKMMVPAGEVTFTLVDNGDDTLTLSYTVEGGGTGGDPSDPSDPGDLSDFYLFGYIDRANYGCEDDYANLGEYGFDSEGKLTANFVADSYVGVKSSDNNHWYMTDGWLGSVPSATLYDTAVYSSIGTFDKLFVPGGVEITFTLVDNGDDTLTLSYEADLLQIEDNSGIQDGATFHAWNWSFSEIEEQMQNIARQGFTAIQTSPVQPLKEPTNLSHHSVGGNWWVYYQPVDFVITTDSGNALGTKSDLESMIAVAHEYGIKVIVDVVANHLGNKTSNDLAEAIPQYLRNENYWHDITQNTSPDDYNKGNRTGITQKCMGGLPDLNTANKDVQGYVLDFLKECIDIGVDGFRFDAAKHIETPDDDASIASDFWPTVIGGAEAYAMETRGIDLYCYGETLDEPGGMIPISAYTKYMSVTDNSWGNTLRGNIASGKAAMNAGYNKVADPGQLVIWAESHDTYADGSSSYVSGVDINKTWALVAARADAMGLYLARPADLDKPIGANYDTNWSEAVVREANLFHSSFAGQGETVNTYGDFIYVERGNSGVVIVAVRAGAGQTVNVDVPVSSMADGTYLDQLSGSEYTVINGRLTGTISINGVSVVYNKEECTHEQTVTVTEEATCEEEGRTYEQCVHCGEIFNEEVISALGHGETEIRDAKDPTCTEPGYTGDTYCTVCGEKVADGEAIDALGHNYQEGVCTVCGAEDPNHLPENPFEDVKEGDYFYTPVLWAVKEGITTGTTATTFSPEDPCTRGQIVTFLWRAFGSPEPTENDNPFTDVSEDMYYYKAVLWAVEQGITTGTSATTFSPEETCTRGQVATFLWRACGKPAPQSEENPFTDVDSSTYYYEPILWAVESGVTNGTGDGEFSPEDSCTRGQIVTFLYRALAE